MKSLTGDFMVCRIFQSAIVSMIYMILSYLLSSLKAIYMSEFVHGSSQAQLAPSSEVPHRRTRRMILGGRLRSL